MTRRFFAPDAVHADRAEISGPLAHRLASVLRLRPGDAIALFDGSGQESIVMLREVDAKRISGVVTGTRESPPEPRTRVRLFQSITKGDRFEWLVEKATELGVSEITPLMTARSVVKTAGEGNRIDRWRRIAIEAAEQCNRGAVPAIEAPVPFSVALERAATGVVLLPYESAGETAPSIADVLRSRIDELFACSEVSILIGPEGGLEEAEVDQAREAGAVVLTLGERVLRSETAGLVALTLTLEACGELG